MEFDRNKTGSKIENPTHPFKEAYTRISNEKQNCDELKFARSFFVPLFLSERVFQQLCFISMYSVLSTHSEYTYFYMLKTSLRTLLFLVFKIVESFQCILNNDMTVIRGSYPCNIQVKSKMIFYNLPIF